MKIKANINLIRFRIVLILLLASLALGSNIENTIDIAHATSVENLVDLSNLSSDTEQSHSHIWVDKYDADYHWQQCEICKTVNSKEKHSLNSKYTISSTSCSKNNKKITSCSLCEYSIEQGHNNSHRFYDMGHSASGLWSRCGNCMETMSSQAWGDTFYIGNNAINSNNFTVPNTIRDKFGNSYYVNQKQVYTMTPEEKSLITSTYSINNGYFYITTNFKLSDQLLPYINLNRVTDQSYLYAYLWCGHIVSGSEGTYATIAPTGKSWNASTKTLTVNYSFKLRDTNKNWNTTGTIEPTLKFHNSTSNGGVNMGYYLNTIRLNTNLTEPIISNTNIGN